jgi:ubiquinone/menaquinone biosynthesis C-methylase UbiE
MKESNVSIELASKYYYWKIAMAYWEAHELEAYRRFADLPSGGRFLDVGCGDGVFGKMIKETLNIDEKMIGLDSDVNSLRSAEGLKDTYQDLFHNRAESMPFRKNTFSVALSNQALHCMGGDPRCALKEISRVTKRGGIFICTIMPKGSMDSLLVPSIQKRNIKRRVPMKSEISLNVWKNIINEEGMSILNIVPFMSGNRYKMWSLFMALPFRIIGFLKFIDNDTVKGISYRFMRYILSKIVEDEISFEKTEEIGSVLIVSKVN